MRSGLQLFAFLVCVFSCYAAPVPYAESLRRLEELKSKLVQLEETLRSFDSVLQDSVLEERSLLNQEISPEAQALFDNHKSLQDAIAGALAKGDHTDADEDAEVPEAEQEEEDDKRHLNNIYRQLSPENQALLDKHPSLQNVINAALNKGGHSDADEDAEVPDAEEEEEEERRDAMHVYRELSPEEQALIDKYQSLKNKIDAAFERPGHADAEEDAEIADADEENDEERRVNNYYREVSSDDQALLDKHKSLQAVIEAAMAKGGHSDADEDAAVPDADEEEEERRDATHVYRELTSEQQALVDKHPSLKALIEAALAKNGHADDEEDAAMPDGEDSEVDDERRHLSPEDQALLDRFQSRQSLINAEMNANHGGPESEDAEVSEDETISRRGNANVFTYMAQLPAEDQELLKRMRSKIPHLQLALDKKNSRDWEAKRGQEEEVESLVSESEEDDKLNQFEKSLSPDDLALLRALKSKLYVLRDSLHGKSIESGDSASQSEAVNVPGVDAGPLEDRREAKMDGWNEQPLRDDDLGSEESDLEERCPCQKHKESGKRCACDKDFQKRCPKCHQNEAIIQLMAERCPTCHKDKTPDMVVEEVHTRLMNDIEFAQSNGMSVVDLIDQLKAKNAERVVNEERELELLANF